MRSNERGHCLHTNMVYLFPLCGRATRAVRAISCRRCLVLIQRVVHWQLFLQYGGYTLLEMKRMVMRSPMRCLYPDAMSVSSRDTLIMRTIPSRAEVEYVRRMHTVLSGPRWT